MRYGPIVLADSGSVSFEANGTLSAQGVSGSMTVSAGGGAVSSSGGPIVLQAGAGGSASGDGGSASLLAGSAVTSGAGGSLSLTAGGAAGTNQAGGSVTLTGGAPTGTGAAGAISLIAGNNASNVGANIVLRAGRGSSSANDGVIRIDRTSTDNRAVRLQFVAGPTNANTVSLSAPASVTSSYSMTLPAAQGAANSFLQNNGSGGLTWATSTGKLLQTLFTEVSANTTTTSTTFVTLLTQSITITGGSDVIVNVSFSASNTNNNRQVFFRVTIDGTPVRGAAAQTAGTAGFASAGAIVYRATGLAAGAHTVLLQWRVAANTGQVRPVAAPDAEHASLLVQEVTP